MTSRVTRFFRPFHFVFCLLMLLLFASCEEAEKPAERASRPEGIVQSRVDANGQLHLALVVAPKRPGGPEPDLSAYRGTDFLQGPNSNTTSGPRGQIDPEPLPRSPGMQYLRMGNWILRDGSLNFGTHEWAMGYSNDNIHDEVVAYSSDQYFVYDGIARESQEVTFSNGTVTGKVSLRRAGTALYASFNDGPERRIYHGYSSNDPPTVFVRYVLPLKSGLLGALDPETIASYVGKWTVSASPEIPPLATGEAEEEGDVEMGGTPFHLYIRAIVIDNIRGVYRPDIPVPDSEEKLCAGATFTATARTLAAGSSSPPGNLHWKAAVLPPGGGDPLRTIYGDAGAYNPGGTPIEVNWDGKDNYGRPLPGEKKYGVLLTAVVSTDVPETPGGVSGRFASNGDFGPPEAVVNPHRIQITPNPYIPYAPEELEFIYDENGYPVWPDNNGDGMPDFPDHDGDGFSDFEAGSSPPGIHFYASLHRNGWETSAWIAEVVSEEGEVLHTETSQEPDQDINFEWMPPADLEPQTLKLRVSGTRCPRNSINLIVLAQGTGGNCQPIAFDASVNYGRKVVEIEKIEFAGAESISPSLGVAPYPRGLYYQKTGTVKIHHPVLLTLEGLDGNLASTSGVSARQVGDNTVKVHFTGEASGQEDRFDFRVMRPDGTLLGTETVTIPPSTRGSAVRGNFSFVPDLERKVQSIEFIKVEVRRNGGPWIRDAVALSEPIYVGVRAPRSPFSTSASPTKGMLDIATYLAREATTEAEVRGRILNRMPDWLRSKGFIYNAALFHFRILGNETFPSGGSFHYSEFMRGL